MSRLADLRLKHGFETQQDLADAADLSSKTISRIELGETLAPSGKTLIRLARAFDADPTELGRHLSGEDASANAVSA